MADRVEAEVGPADMRSAAAGRCRGHYDDGFSVVVPVFNAEGSVVELCTRIEAALQAFTSRYEIVLVDDGSKDASGDVVDALAATNEKVVSVRLMRNYGQHNALLSGIREASLPAVVTIDDDLQSDPADIPVLLAALLDSDVVYGCPIGTGHGWRRTVASKAIKLVLAQSLGDRRIKDVSSFRAFRTDLRIAFERYDSPFVCIDVLLSWATSRFKAVSVSQYGRRWGATNYTTWRLITHALNMVTGFTTLPLQVVSMLGFALTGFGAGVLVYVVASFLVAHHPVAGFTFLASIIAIFSGTQLFALGVFGEYLARMHFRVMGKPAYVVRERSGDHVPMGGSESCGNCRGEPGWRA